jgi:hypothetical protein
MNVQLPGRSQFRHILFAPRAWSRHDAVYFPLIRDALEPDAFAFLRQPHPNPNQPPPPSPHDASRNSSSVGSSNGSGSNHTSKIDWAVVQQRVDKTAAVLRHASHKLLH